MIEHIVLDYDTTPEILTYNSLIHYKGKKKFRDVKSIEAKVNTQDLTLSFLGPMFPNLERLRLNNSIISSIRDIGCSFPKLKFLSLAQCNITSLDGIATISPNLQELYLAGNKIPDLIDLMGVNQLKIIDLEDNGISKFSTIEILKLCDKLTTVTLKNNPIAVDPNYRKKIFELLPKLAYLDETRPGMSIAASQPPPVNINTNKPTTNQSSQKVQTAKPVQASKQPSQANQPKPAGQQTSKASNPQKSEKSNKPSQKVEIENQTEKQSSNAQLKKRAPSAAAALNAKKVEMPTTAPTQSPRKVHQPPLPEGSVKSNNSSANKNPRGTSNSGRKARPNTKMAVSKLSNSAPNTPSKEPQKSGVQPPKQPAHSIPQTVNPDDLFPEKVSPHAKQMSDRFTAQKETENQQFNDVKKPLNRTTVISSARKVKGKTKSTKNGDEIMTDMVHDKVEENNIESRQNKSNLYERSAFPELNSISVKKKPNRNVNPEIIKPLSAKGPLYI